MYCTCTYHPLKEWRALDVRRAGVPWIQEGVRGLEGIPAGVALEPGGAEEREEMREREREREREKRDEMR